LCSSACCGIPRRRLHVLSGGWAVDIIYDLTANNRDNNDDLPPMTTTTTIAIPPAPETVGVDAAATLVDAWAAGNRQEALSIATPKAVATLFAVAYPSGLASSRGCSDPPVPPVVCSYGPPGRQLAQRPAL